MGGNKFNLIPQKYTFLTVEGFGNTDFRVGLTGKHSNFQFVTVKNLIFSCPEKDRKMTNRDPSSEHFFEIGSLCNSIVPQI